MDSPTADATRQRQREAVSELGMPIFVPAGDWEAIWRFSGAGRSRTSVTNVSVSATDYQSRSHVVVMTYKENHGAAQGQHDAGLVASVLFSAVPPDVRLPLTMTVDERALTVLLGASETVELRMFIARSSWVAFGPIQNRWVQIQGTAMKPDGLALDSLTDPRAIAEARWL